MIKIINSNLKLEKYYKNKKFLKKLKRFFTKEKYLYRFFNILIYIKSKIYKQPLILTKTKKYICFLLVI